MSAGHLQLEPILYDLFVIFLLGMGRYIYQSFCWSSEYPVGPWFSLSYW